jgi:2-oxoglutarate dehydrogenase E1 component
MSDLPITSVFNDAYIAEAFEAYRRDPASVDESWRQFFRFAEALGGAQPAAGAADPELLRKTAAAASLVHAVRQFGHLAVQIDPLGTPPLGARELTPEYHGIAEADLEAVPASALGFDARFRTAGDVVRMLRRRYQGAIGYEYAHLSDDNEREWFRRMLRKEELTRALTPEEKTALLQRLTEVDGLERFLGRAYQGKKRFSIEGTDALVPMLDAAIAEGAARGVRQVVIGMAHRGRLNVLTHVLGKPYRTLFGEFEGRHADTNSASDTGDVKYHMGYRGTRQAAGAEVAVQLVPNPSHLEVVNPVVSGVARALRREHGDVLTVVVHGDAAFIGEGVVAETFNMSRLRGYEVGGTLHVIANNQVGFTTDPIDARSTHYASDLALGFDVPVLHVNADDAEACIVAIRVGIAYRAQFGKDFVIDLVGYRRWGHNETDEPAYTQPELYAKIKQHPTPRQVFAKRLVGEGVVTDAQVEEIDRGVAAKLEAIHDEMRRTLDKDAAVHDSPEGSPAPTPSPVETAVPAERLAALNERLLAWPEGFNVHRTLARVLERRRAALEQGGIDWGHAEALALGSLLADGTTVRITGQDVERGTFSHRQAVLHDGKTGETYVPLQHVAANGAAFEIYNSPLTETGVTGFEYGFSLAAPDALVLWEAQFGDFANVAQPVFDQFLSADRAKWGQDSSLVLLLPHGYEGQGPEHSSARLERFLQLCAERNLVVAYPSTAAQYFHVLRRQARRPAGERRPLVLMQPKSMLRLPQATSTGADLASGTFQPVIDDPRFASNGASRADRGQVKRVAFCTGKLYHELAASEALGPTVALVRVEELYPWPGEEVTRVLDQYPAAEEVVWVQEEPMNMGAWTYAAPRLAVATGAARYPRYVGRPERASPAEGYEAAHKIEQARIVAEAVTLGTGAPAGPKRGKSKAGAK